MTEEIKARGWIWVKSDKPTAWVTYECISCRQVHTYPAKIFDLLRCPNCGVRPYFPIGYVRKVKEVKE